MDIGKAFSFVFEDQDWIKKALIGAVLALTGIGFIPILGYGLEVARRVAQGHPQPLPEWDDWGKKIIEGLLGGLIGFVWALPITLIGVCLAVALSALSGAGVDSDTAAVAIPILSICLGLIIFVYSLAMMLVLPAAISKYAVTGELGAAFRFGEIIGMVRGNLVTFLMVLLISVLAQVVASLGGIVVCIGALFTNFYAVLIVGHAYGQAYRIAAGDVAGSAPDVYAY